MSHQRPLQGACSCGRNRYLLLVPSDTNERIHVVFDGSSENRRSQAAPLTAWLRVPLNWYQSYTQSYYPDETNATIRRTFTPHHEPYSKRNFCGFCGTHLSYWSEQPPSESDYLHVTVGSLLGEDLRALEELDLLPPDTDTEALTQANTGSRPNEPNSALSTRSNYVGTTERRGTNGDLSWFEEMISGSALGRTTRSRRGMGVSPDGTTAVEWEVTEVGDSGTEADSGIGRSKRKIGEVARGDDVEMKQ